MGLLKWVNDLGSGIVDVAKSPFGLVWDLARSLPNPDYTIGEAFATNFGQFGEGLGKISDATGLSAVARVGKEHTGIDEVIGGALNQMLLLYDHEYQMRTNQAPLGLDRLGWLEPGQTSIARVAGTGLGMAGSLLGAAGQLAGQDVGELNLSVRDQYKRSMNVSPGQAFVDSMMFGPGVTDAEKMEARSGTWYTLLTGGIDAATGWIVDPGVIAGKSLKHANRRFWNPHSVDVLEKGLRDISGMDVQRANSGPIPLYKVGSDPSGGRTTAYVVLQQGQLRHQVLMRGDDYAHLSKMDAELHPYTQGPPTPGSRPRTLEPSDPLTRVFYANEAATVGEYADNLLRQYPDNPPVILEIDAVGLHFYADDITGMGFDITPLVNINDIGGLRINRVHRPTSSLAENAFHHAGDMSGSQRIGPVSRRIAEMDRADYLSAVEGDYIAPRMHRGPKDTRPDGVYTDVDAYGDLSIVAVRNSEQIITLEVTVYNGKPIDFVLLSSEARPKVTKTIVGPLPALKPVTMHELNAVFRALQERFPSFSVEDFAKLVEPGSGPITLAKDGARAAYNIITRTVRNQDRLAASRVRDSFLYTPEGTPRAPDQLINHIALAEDHRAVVDLLRQPDGPVEAEKFLRARQEQRSAPPTGTGTSLIDQVANNRRVQDVVNWCVKVNRTPDEIRRRIWSSHPQGAALSRIMSKARTYSEARWVVLAGMGVKIPESVTMAPLMRARLNNLQIRWQAQLDPMRQLATFSERVEGALLSPTREILADDLVRMEKLAHEELSVAVSDLSFAKQLSDIAATKPLRMVPQLTVSSAIRESVRTSWLYQHTPLSRPIRSAVEMRPHQWVNMHDPMADVQLVRQLEEARPLGINAEDVTRFRNQFISAPTDSQRALVVVRAEQFIIRTAAKKAGLTTKQVEQAVHKIANYRQSTTDWLNSRKFAPDGQDIRKITDMDTGEITIIHLPVAATQLPNWVPMADVRQIAKVTSRFRAFTSRGAKIPEQLLDSFYHIWKPTVLLRGGWPIRVVSDEQLRILARCNSLMHHLAAIEMGETPKWTRLWGGYTVSQRIAGAFGLPVTVGVAAGTRVSSAAARAAKRLGYYDPEYLKLLKQAGVEPLVSARASFGGPNEGIMRQFEATFGAYHGGIVDHYRSSSSGQWASVDMAHPQYRMAWRRALNDQIGRDEMWGVSIRELLDGLDAGLDLETAVARSNKATLAWLKTEPGITYAERLPWYDSHHDFPTWVDERMGILGQYSGNYNRRLLKETLDHKVSNESMLRIDVDNRPKTVHAELIDQASGKGGFMGGLRNLLAETFDIHGRLPTDTLSRNPMFAQVYADEMTRLKKIADMQGEVLTKHAYDLMDGSAREFALSEVKVYLYDLAERSRFADMMRWYIPFFPAFQEVLTVWAKLAKNDPSVIARGLQIWRAPNKAGLVVTDEDGNEFIQLQLSESVADKLGLTGWAKYVTTGGIRLSKSSFNMMLNGPLPGIGPIVQIPLNEIVKMKPELEDSLRWALPYGVQPNSFDVMLSPMLKRLKSWIKGHEGDASYQRNLANAIAWLDYQTRSGARTIPPTFEEAKAIADALFNLQLMANYMAPAQPIFDSPLKPYMDVWRDLSATLPADEAEELFLRTYGEEFAAVMMSRTRSATGIPPTVEAQVARRPVADLIETYPEYGRIIIGEDAALGEFSSAAYAWQLTHDYDPNNVTKEMEREYRPMTLNPDTGLLESVDSRLGWIKYTQFMDSLDAELMNRGLTSLRVSGASDLNELKKVFTEDLAREHPAWETSFAQRNDLKWRDRIKAFRELSKEAVLQDRPDWDGIRDYLQVRQLVLDELNRRKQIGGSATLDATSNHDLAIVWDGLVAEILRDNLAFGPVYWRYLENDPLELRS